jgi:GNAT superfamily N-acetyltransferase
MGSSRQGDGLQIVAAPAPPSLASGQAWAVHGVAGLERAIQESRWGHHDLAYSALESLVKLRDSLYTRRIQLVAVGADRAREVLGAAILRLPQRGNTHLVEVDVLVRPDREGRGVDDALLRAALEQARAHCRRVVILSSEHTGEPAADDPDALLAPTGSGRVDRTDAGAALALRSGPVSASSRPTGTACCRYRSAPRGSPSCAGQRPLSPARTTARSPGGTGARRSGSQSWPGWRPG